MKFGGMIGYYPGTIWLDCGIARVKGQGQGNEKVPKKWLRRRYALYWVPVLVYSCFIGSYFVMLIIINIGNENFVLFLNIKVIAEIWK